MSRVASPPRSRLPRVVGLLLALASFAGSLPAAAQDLPPCGEGRTHDCRLSDWSAAGARDVPSLFGEIEGVVWYDDPEGDAPPAGLDIRGVGLGLVDIDDPGAIRDADGLLKVGKRKKAVRSGPGVVVRIVLDRSLEEVSGDHASVHVATDIDGSRSNNAPTGVADPGGPFAGSQDIYSLTWASTTGQEKLLASNLAKGWYKDKTPFAAAWAAPGILDVLLAPEAIGDGFRVITHVKSDEGGYDSAAVGLGPIASDGEVGYVPSCIEGAIRDEPFVVGRLVENGQTLRDVAAPASWRGGVSLPVEGETQQALTELIATSGDADGHLGIGSTVSLFEDGLVIRQQPDVELALVGDQAQLAMELGLTRRGYNVLRDIELDSTGDERVDAWLERATDAWSEYLPPFRSTRKAGLVAGEGVGACVDWLAPVLDSTPGPSPGVVAAPSPAASPAEIAGPASDPAASGG